MGAITFGNPPLVEVSFCISFERLKNFRTGYYGLYWSSVQEEFPETTDKVPVGQTPEFEGWFPPARVWLIHREKHLVLQIQQDRFIVSWRKIGPNSKYPRFAGLKPMFMRHFQAFQRFVEEQGLGTLKIDGGELRYVNHVIAEGAWKGSTEISKVFVGLNWDVEKTGCREPQTLGWRATWASGSANLRAEIEYGSPGEESQPEKAVFEIRANAREKSVTDAKSAELWFGVANEAIVRGFTSLTTEWAHNELWDRKSS